MYTGWSYTCHPCNQEFCNEEELATHLESSHNTGLKTEISNSETKPDQENEMTENQGSSFHVCKICEKSFRNKSSLSEHRWIHSDRNPPWRCDNCDKIFPFYSRLKKHQFTHIEKSNRSIIHKCSQCDKTFFRKNDLWSHEKAKGHRYFATNTDSEGEPNKMSVYQLGYQCKDCGRVLASSGSLFNHRQRFHNGDESNRRFPCPDCGERFFLKQKMFKHFQSKHFNK